MQEVARHLQVVTCLSRYNIRYNLHVIILYPHLCRDELLWKRIVVRSCYGEAAAWGEVSLCPGTLSWFREAEDARPGAASRAEISHYLTLYPNLKTHLTARIPPPPVASTGG